MIKRHAAPALLGLLLLAGCGGGNALPPPQPVDAGAGNATVAADLPVDRAALDAAIAPLFADPALGETRALIIHRNGEPLYERYGEGFGPDTRLISWSMAKTVTALLVGLMVADGRLQLDAPAPVPAWQKVGDPRGAITLRQLLHMAGGLQHDEGADTPYLSDEVRMMFLEGRRDNAAHAEGQPLEARPGEKFEYSTATSTILADIVTDQLTDSTNPMARARAMDAFLKGRLAEPLGLDSLVAEYDAAGTLQGGSFMHATARDWVRLGDFMRVGGTVRGAQVVPRGWIAFMRTASPRESSYGGHVWLNRPRTLPTSRNVLFPGTGPDSLFAAVGHLGQYVLVSPDQGLVVVRLGYTRNGDRDALEDALGRVVALFPGR